MHSLLKTFLLATLASLCASAQIAPDEATKVNEFYRLADRIQDRVWIGWSGAPKGLVLVTPQTEYITHYSHPPNDFHSVGGGFLARPRTFDPGLQATFPAFGPEPVIVIGEPKANAVTPWVFTAMHEHFHQLQDSQHGYYEGVEALGLSKGDKTGMWMLNYPFPYKRADLQPAFRELRDALLRALNGPSGAPLKSLVSQYAETRRRFLAQVSADEAKYFEFETWQEGIARYTEIQAAEEAAKYQPSSKFAALPGYTPFSAYAGKARQNTLDELRGLELADAQRLVVYSVGAGEGLLLDRLASSWKTVYFDRPFSLSSFFTEFLTN
jgi:hypothetical protein